MYILSFLVNFRYKSPLPLKKKFRLGDDIGINIISKSSTGQIHRFFDCLGYMLWYLSNWNSEKYDIHLQHFLPCLCFFVWCQKGKNFICMTSIRSLTPSTRTEPSSCRQFFVLVICKTNRLCVIAFWFSRYSSLLSYLYTLKSSVMTC